MPLSPSVSPQPMGSLGSFGPSVGMTAKTVIQQLHTPEFKALVVFINGTPRFIEAYKLTNSACGTKSSQSIIGVLAYA
ncbi:hypothetical protein JHK87_027904 [Glycine soja]|nr:hypothetical protein JHK87_027904 [Glycine soja]